MDVKKYIDSGILELYVCGALNDADSREVSAHVLAYDEIRQEVERIEKNLRHLARSAAPYTPVAVYAGVLDQTVRRDAKVVPIQGEEKTGISKIITYLSVAATIALLIGLFSVLDKNDDLEQEIQVVEAQKNVLEDEIDQYSSRLSSSREVLAVLRDTSVTRVKLAGQQVAPQSYVQVYWDKAQNAAYIDAQGLPDPPAGKVYQVWSLKLDPLTPTSIGLLENFEKNDTKIFQLQNPNDSQAFGITLEPAGGSESPTMEQLYTLGAVQA